jgi:hypothetical protein
LVTISVASPDLVIVARGVRIEEVGLTAKHDNVLPGGDTAEDAARVV